MGVDSDGEGVLVLLDWVLTRGGGAAGDAPNTGELRVDLERSFLCVIKQNKGFRESAREGEEERGQREGTGYSTVPESVKRSGGSSGPPARKYSGMEAKSREAREGDQRGEGGCRWGKPFGSRAWGEKWEQAR
jgi:hypothetical protein